MSTRRAIRQIIPATGWRAVAVTRWPRDPDPERDILELPVVCFALLAEDAAEPVEEMVMRPLWYGGGIAFGNDLFRGEEREWDLLTYLGPGESSETWRKTAMQHLEDRARAVRERHASPDEASGNDSGIFDPYR